MSDTKPEPANIDEPPKPVVESSIDISKLEKQEHIWVERGAKVSCEGANHPHHSHFLVRR